MLERLNTPGFEAASKPSEDAVEVLQRIVASATGPVAAAEIGVGVGATTLELVRALGGAGELHLFDRKTLVDQLVAELEAMPETAGVTLVNHGNSRKTFDGYAWVLATMARDLANAGKPVEIFDFVYLDGAHSFHHDAPATAVLKRMIKPGGYLVVDDMKWSFNSSPTMNPTKRPAIRDSYTDEQLEVPHVRLIVDVLLRPDEEFQEIFLGQREDPGRTVFQRVTPDRGRRGSLRSARRSRRG